MSKTCSVENCESKSRAKGYCNKHYQQMLKHGRIIDEDIANKEIKTCSVENCNNKHYSKGYCCKHYSQFKRHGEIIDKIEYSICTAPNCTNKTISRFNPYCKRHNTQIYRYGEITNINKSKNEPNEIIEYEDYAEMVLYNKNGEEVARTIIDLDDVDKVKNIRWYMNHNYVINRDERQLHHFLMNCPEDLIVDHINHNTLDNRKSNLRVCTAQENSWNRSNVSGVYKRKNEETWLAYIEVNGGRIHLGYFKTKEEAIEARRQAEIEYFGEFAPTKE